MSEAIQILMVGMAGIMLLIMLLLGLGLVGKLLGKKDQDTTNDEAKLMQDMHRQLNRMEQRIESLETILTEEERSRSRR